MRLDIKTGLRAEGFYEWRDSTCENCNIKFERIKGKFVCPICGGDIGRLKGKGKLL